SQEITLNLLWLCNLAHRPVEFPRPPARLTRWTRGRTIGDAENRPPEEPMSTNVSEAALVAVPKEDPFTLSVTDAAVNKVKDFAAKMPDADGKALRVFIQGGGCSGFQYGFTFDEQKPNDYVLKVNDVTVVVDKTSALKLHGSTVD